MARDTKKKGRKKPTEDLQEESLKPIDITREDIEGWRGGLPINLENVDESGSKLREKLSTHISTVLDQELQNHTKVIENLSKWQRQYQGKKSSKNYPYAGCANMAVPISRSNVDTTQVRVQDALFNKKKTYLCRARHGHPEFVGVDRQVEEFLDWFTKNVMKLKEKSSDSLLQSTKMGSGWGKMVWEQKTRSVYRYANEAEKFDTTVTKYKLNDTDEKAVKDVETLYSGPNFYPISREDIVYSADATNVQDCYIIGFRKYYREPQIHLKVKQGLWDKEAVSSLTAPDKFDEVKEDRAENQGLDIKKSRYEDPYEIWELWVKYDVDGDGQEDDIVVTYHRQSNQILRAIYNPLFYSFRPFVLFKGFPIEFTMEGEGLLSILEKLQEEIDSIHNQRLDRLTQINAPMYLVKKGCSLDNFALLPGKVWHTDEVPEDAVRELSFADVYHSNFNEEDRLIALADRACGIYPESMGQSTSERPVAKESLARIEEANKKFKAIIENYRQGFIDLGYMIIEMFAQYQPVYTYRAQEGGKWQEKTINFPLQSIRDGLEIELFASTELISQEVRREINMTVYGLVSDFKTKAAGVVQAIVNPQVPSYFKVWGLTEYKSSLTLVRRILDDFDIRDADTLLIDLEKIPGLEQCIQNSIDLQPPPPQPMTGPDGQPIGPGGGGPGGPPGMGGGPPMGPPGM